jgi:8-oxo-dGTP diphosphatase
MLQLRLPLWSLSQVRELSTAVVSRPPSGCVRVLLNGDIEGAQAIGTGVGVHLKSGQLMSLTTRPLPSDQPVSASCHNATELDRAVRLGLDFVTLSPVAPTRMHPNATPMGWHRFRDLVSDCPLPVYALGGMSPNDLADAVAHDGHGVAGIHGFW